MLFRSVDCRRIVVFGARRLRLMCPPTAQNQLCMADEPAGKDKGCNPDENPVYHLRIDGKLSTKKFDHDKRNHRDHPNHVKDTAQAIRVQSGMGCEDGQADKDPDSHAGREFDVIDSGGKIQNELFGRNSR